MEITRGKIQKAQKVAVYGPEGIGKSTFASHFPNPLWSDVEESTTHMDVARLPKATSWEMLKSHVDFVLKNPDVCQTFVIDTADWAEILCVNHVCAKNNIKGIEDLGYGKGYVYLAEEFGRFLNKLNDVVDAGINVVILAHAKMRKFEQPDELGAYDRWELKLSKQVAPLIKEWADAVLFANYKTTVVNVDNQGAVKGKNKAQGGKRIMHTQHHPCWDAKNRWGLSEETDFDFAVIAPHIPGNTATAVPKQAKPAVESTPPKAETPQQAVPNVAQTGTEPKHDYSGLPKALTDLMSINSVTKEHIQAVVGKKGYFPADMPVEDYPSEFIEAVLVGAWEQVFGEIKELEGYYPF